MTTAVTLVAGISFVGVVFTIVEVVTARRRPVPAARESVSVEPQYELSSEH